MNKDYARVYERWTAAIRKSPVALFLVRFVNQSVTRLMYLFYPLLLVLLAWQEPHRLWLYILVPGVGFVLVSLLRHRINQPRPYERWSISPLWDKETRGQSMPSRHVFSATIISMCILSVNPYLGSILLLLSAVLAICRVLAGVHYPKDVLFGFLLGLAVGSFVFWG